MARGPHRLRSAPRYLRPGLVPHRRRWLAPHSDCCSGTRPRCLRRCSWWFLAWSHTNTVPACRGCTQPRHPPDRYFRRFATFGGAGGGAREQRQAQPNARKLASPPRQPGRIRDEGAMHGQALLEAKDAALRSLTLGRVRALFQDSAWTLAAPAWAIPASLYSDMHAR
jgi:hypothetical protein